MNLPPLPANCWYVFHHAARGFVHGLRHGPFRPHRHVVRRIAHHPAPHGWFRIVCRGAGIVGQGVGSAIIGTGVAVGGYSAGQGLGMQFPASPPEIVQPFAGGPGGFGGGGYSGGGVLYPPYYGHAVYPTPPQVATVTPSVEIVPPETVVLSPPTEITPPPTVVTQELPPPPKAVDEPASALLLLTFGLVGATAIAVSKKAAH